MKQYFYITTTAPYVNADPHIGFALEITQADAIARFKKLQGYQVAFGFGTDEHGLKIYRNALLAKKNPQQYCDDYARKFNALKTALNLSVTHFIRTTDPAHATAAQEFWQRCYKNGDIYKKNYKVKYCVGCEMEKTDSELVNSRCPIHPNLSIEIYEEENYFFRFSKYQSKLLALYKNPEFILPSNRLQEIKNFVNAGLKDFSVSRLKKKMPWGIDVPNDPCHVMYVWFDALVFYLSNIGWPTNEKTFKHWWPVTQIAGKDNLRQQAAIWQAMLASAGLPYSKQIVIHGFINADGQKMSKSLGNVIDPFNLINQYGTDAVRYYLLKEIPPFADGNFSYQRMQEIYNADLANELGNLVSRLLTLATKDRLTITNFPPVRFDKKIIDLFEQYQFNTILDIIWQSIKNLNKQIDLFSPWKKKPFQRRQFLYDCLYDLYKIGYQLQPFLPATSKKIIQSTTKKITQMPLLFPRINHH